jgi:hypothetical protein
VAGGVGEVGRGTAYEGDGQLEFCGRSWSQRTLVLMVEGRRRKDWVQGVADVHNSLAECPNVASQTFWRGEG